MSSLRAQRPLAYRLLFHNALPDAQLPPLVPSHSPELTAELYDLIALALRSYVVPWWSKISRYDKQFLPQITRIITAFVYHLDARIRAAPLVPLLLVELPAVVTQHYRDYRNAQSKLGTSYATGAAVALPQLFHHLQPHVAISPEGKLDPEYFRYIIDHVLKASLPPEDYEPETERIIIREIILKLLLCDIIPKITQPWFIQRSILDLLHFQYPLSQPSHSPSPPSNNPISFHAALVIFLSVIQNMSGMCLSLVQGYRHVVSTIKHVMQLPISPSDAGARNLARQPLILLSEIFTLHERIASTILFVTIRVFADLSMSFVDRLFPYILTGFFSSQFTLSLIRTSKRTLFPNGYPGPPPIEPTSDEQAEIYSRLTGWKPDGALASHILTLLIGPDPTRTLEEAAIPLTSQQCNAHLFLFLFDCIIATLFPELLVASSGSEQGM